MLNNMAQKKEPRQQLNKPLFNSAYIAEKFIGEGGMSSEVYLVHHIKDPKTIFAAKVIYCEGGYTKDFVKRFGAEAITSLRVFNKQNLVQTYEVFPTPNDEALIFIMDYVEGVSLEKYMKQQGCMSPKQALSIFKKICIGVKELHSFKKQIIHRDLKPNNIILSKDLSKVTLIDFGISAVVERTKDYLNKNNTKIYTYEEKDQIWGTGPYVIPDALNHPTPSVQFDFYSLGVILYHMIMGKLPFDRSGCKDDAAKVVKLPLTYDIPNISANPTIPVALENLIFKCMASKKEDLKYRYNDIQEIINDVERVSTILNNKNNKDILLKPIEARRYQQPNTFNIDVIKTRQKWYKKWGALAIFGGFFIAVLIVAIVVLFVL